MIGDFSLEKRNEPSLTKTLYSFTVKDSKN
jgi:hypothetical protein